MEKKRVKVAMLSTYPPRECGIANFTADLLRELKKIPGLEPAVIAVSDDAQQYGEDVIFAFPQERRESYKEVALRLNQSGVDVLVVQHEYGIFGGDCGEYLLDLLNNLRIPVVSVLHTVLLAPEKKQKRILQELCAKSVKVVTMANNAKELLKKVYKVNPAKVEVIHHGVPRLLLPSREELKRKDGLDQRTIVSTFGLLSPGKGLEYGIEAIGQVAKKHSNILYLILGQTHPVVKRRFGEAYRHKLEEIVRERKLEDHVRFVNKYLTREEIIRYLKMSDIYMTPYLGKEQAVSGTLAYAVGYGRVVVSTPYPYAQEMLADGRGLLAEFGNAESLAKQLNFLLEHPEEKRRMEQKTELLGEGMMWDQVAKKYGELLTMVSRDADEKLEGAAQ